MVRIKLCGVTSLDDALRASEMGIDILGFNFVSDSPRWIEPGEARAIAERLPAFVLRVGIFANEPRESLLEMAGSTRIHCIQFHGEEDPEECASSPLPWYKAHRTSPDFRPEDVQHYDSSTCLIDTYEPGLRGGTGRPGDWNLARRASAHRQVILAGGLTPDNVGEAILTAGPYAVDVNSGVESSPGRKDFVSLARFVAQVAEACHDGGPTP